MASFEETPYEILEVSPNVTFAELNQAFQQALRRKTYPQPVVVQAFNDLRNPAKRLEYELLSFNTELEVTALHQWARDLPPFEFIAGEVDLPPLEVTLAQVRLPTALENEVLPEFPLTAADDNPFARTRVRVPLVPFP